jgi:chemotaxis regulatin CheY-phosphate phosphatase CheZ
MIRTPSRGRPLTPSGHVDRVAEAVVDARGHLIVVMDTLGDAIRALNSIDARTRVLREVVNDRAAA